MFCWQRFKTFYKNRFLFQFRYEVCLKTLHDIPNYVEKRTIRQDYIEKNFNWNKQFNF